MVFAQYDNMIIVKPIGDTYENGFHIEGHAGYAQPGLDIICAGISATARTAYSVLSEITMLSINFSDGKSIVHIKEPDELTSKVITGFLDVVFELEEMYPKFIKVMGDYE